jgi:hypothetical protein
VTFDLPTLALRTAYDAEQPALPLGSSVDDGGHPSVILLDGANRARRRVLRGNRPHPLVGLRTVRATTRVRIAVAILLDEESTRRWTDAQGEDGAGRHRLLTVTAQGVPRATCLLVPDPVLGTTRQRVDFVLEPGELGDLLVLGLEDAAPPAGWGTPLAAGAIGTLVARVIVEELTEPYAPRLSTGAPRAVNARPQSTLRPGYVVLNPGSSGAGAEVRLRPVDGRTHPVRVQVVELGGETLLDEVAHPGAGGEVSVPVTGLAGPVLVRGLDPETLDVRRAFRIGVRG